MSHPPHHSIVRFGPHIYKKNREHGVVCAVYGTVPTQHDDQIE